MDNAASTATAMVRGIGAELARQIVPTIGEAFLTVVKRAGREGAKVWLLARDGEALYVTMRLLERTGALPRGVPPGTVRLLRGLGREVARGLRQEGAFAAFLASRGVRLGVDYLIDTGYRGSIYERMLESLVDEGAISAAEALQWQERLLLITAAPGAARRAGVGLGDFSESPALRRAVLALEHTPKLYAVRWSHGRKAPAYTPEPRGVQRRAGAVLRRFAVQAALILTGTSPANLEEWYHIAGEVVRKEVI